MNEVGAQVVRAEAGLVWVRLDAAVGGCGACKQRSGCGLASAMSNTAATGGLLSLPNTIHARTGERVLVCAAEGEVLRAVWWAYGVPLLAGMAAAAGSMALTGSDLWAGLGMLAGLGAGVLLMRQQRLDSGNERPMLTLKFINRAGSEGG